MSSSKRNCVQAEKTLYGLKHVLKQWYKQLSTKLIDFDFTKSTNDRCLFFMSWEANFVALIVYVDDILVTGNNDNKIEEIKLGEANYFLGIQIKQTQTEILISQQKYTLDIL